MKVLSLAFIIFFSNAVLGTEELVEFSDPSFRARYGQLVSELRCPKCQNQNLEDSNSPISQDLREEIRELLEDGFSNHEIERHLISRYSDFILYRPQVNRVTYLLWSSPIIVLLLGGYLIFRLSRRSSEIMGDRLENDSDRQRLNDLLNVEKHRQ